MQKVIAAIATPPGTAGLGVVRLSGEKALTVAEQVFRPASSSKALSHTAGYTAVYGHVYDHDEKLDECVALVFRAPHSYTGEDVVELSCHGGRYLLQRVLRALLQAGACLAGPGEFTRRAFVNGKLDLTQAEAVGALIGAQGRLAARTALAAREGRLYRAVEDYRRTLLDMAAHLAAFVDYPEEEDFLLQPAQIAAQCEQVLAGLDRLLATYDSGRVLREGIETVIVGCPNVGKSSLMNCLAGSDRSIVTDLPGTTRDVVEDTIRLGDVLLRIADTAGLREADDPVERLGIDRARRRLEQAALILAVFDGTRPLEEEDRRLGETLAPERTVAILNKTDCPSPYHAEYKKYLSKKFVHFVELSAKTGAGLPRLEEAVTALSGIEAVSGDDPLLATERQYACVLRCRDALRRTCEALQAGWTWDAVGVELDEAIGALLELTGERATEAVVDRVFEKFCVGK